MALPALSVHSSGTAMPGCNVLCSPLFTPALPSPSKPQQGVGAAAGNKDSFPALTLPGLWAILKWVEKRYDFQLHQSYLISRTTKGSDIA